MEYDPNHKVLLLVTGGKGEGNTKVWALKINLNKDNANPVDPVILSKEF